MHAHADRFCSPALSLSLSVGLSGWLAGLLAGWPERFLLHLFISKPSRGLSNSLSRACRRDKRVAESVCEPVMTRMFNITSGWGGTRRVNVSLRVRVRVSVIMSVRPWEEPWGLLSSFFAYSRIKATSKIFLLILCLSELARELIIYCRSISLIVWHDFYILLHTRAASPTKAKSGLTVNG